MILFSFYHKLTPAIDQSFDLVNLFKNPLIVRQLRASQELGRDGFCADENMPKF